MALLNDEIIQNVKQMLGDMPQDVKLAVFTDDEHCDYCTEIVQLVNEVAATTDRVSVEQYEIHRDAVQAQALNLKRAPAIAILGKDDYGLRFYGIPSGYEFSTLLHGIQKVSEGESELDDRTKNYLAGLDKPVDLQVFVTPTCPHCPQAAVLAMEMAIESRLVNADIVEASEFPDLANHYNVMGVPLSVVNGAERVEGAAPPQMVVDAIRRSVA
ncbi:MAG: thioredoxin family protein [Anaerolineae bacterium]|nr:thioredoxin family protein [Anaerolineae bacterium]